MMLGRRISSRIRPRSFCHVSTASAKKETWDYDVFIVGGGVVGASLACRLAQSVGRSHGTRIGLIEGRAPPTIDSIKEDAIPDPRVYALTPASVALLESVGAWSLLGKRTRPFQLMQVWEGGASGSIRFDAAASKKDRLGTMAENSMLQAALFDRLSSHEKEGLVDLYCPAQVQGIVFDDGSNPAGPAKVTIVDKDGKKQEIITRLLVGADGANSRVKRARGLPSWGWDYGQRAIVATVAIEGGHLPSAEKVTAWQNFLPEGPLALLPLWNNFCSIVWSTTPAEAERLRRLDLETFITELNSKLQHPVGLLQGPSLPSFVPPAISKAVGGVHHLVESLVVSAALNQGFHLPPLIKEICTPRLAFDLRAEHAQTYVSNRTALIGDAAHTIHPMAGQGLNLGLSDVSALCTLLESGITNEGADIGSAVFLKRYETARQFENLKMLGALTALHRLYQPQEGPVRWLRNVGLGTLNGMSPIKAKIAAQAMGLEGLVVDGEGVDSGSRSREEGGRERKVTVSPAV